MDGCQQRPACSMNSTRSGAFSIPHTPNPSGSINQSDSIGNRISFPASNLSGWRDQARPAHNLFVVPMVAKSWLSEKIVAEFWCTPHLFVWIVLALLQMSGCRASGSDLEKGICNA